MRELTLLVSDLGFPNGVCFSPDESILYVNDTDAGEIHALEVDAGGSVRRRRCFASGIRSANGHVDGMKCDAHGNVWVTGPGGLWVFTPNAVYLGRINFPSRVGNFHWGGNDWSSIFGSRVLVRVSRPHADAGATRAVHASCLSLGTQSPRCQPSARAHGTAVLLRGERIDLHVINGRVEAAEKRSITTSFQRPTAVAVTGPRLLRNLRDGRDLV